MEKLNEMIFKCKSKNECNYNKNGMCVDPLPCHEKERVENKTN
jgi:hypothetical protein